MNRTIAEGAIVLAPHGRDAAIAVAMLEEAGLRASAAADLPSLIVQLRQGAGFALVAEEALRSADLRPLDAFLKDQAEWSDFPFILLTQRGGGLERNPAAVRFLETLGNVTFLERSFHPTTLVSLAKAALRARLRQYEARSRLDTIHASEAQFRAFAQAMPNHAWTAPADGQLDWFNERTLEYSGRTLAELAGDRWTEIVHPDDLAAAGARWAESLASGDTYETEFRIRRADGVYRWHLVRALPIRGGDGSLLRWIGTNTDIDAQKAAEAASTRDRARIWNLSPVVMLVVGENGIIHAVNPSWTRTLGWTPADTVGRNVLDFLPPDESGGGAATLRGVIDGVTIETERDYRTKDGGCRRLRWIVVPENGTIYAFGRDVTAEIAAAAALAETEDALRQSQKMEAVGQLTGGIAHDFNNLLQGITGSLEIVQRRIADGRTGDVERFISGAISAANRAAALTHRLLAFSRRQPLDPKPVLANPLIRSMEDLLRRTIGERIALDLTLTANLWWTLCDHNQLENAILNLVINARDAMPDGGTLTITTENIAADAEARDALPAELPGGDYICIGVADTGIGMDAATIARAFDPFFTTKPLGQGTGLGLSMIYGFARQSEGYATIDSTPGAGTRFRLFLPRHDGGAVTEVAPSVPSAPQRAPGGDVVLVVEDETIVRGLVVEVLGGLGYRTIEAGDGPEGVRLLQSDARIDLLVTDIGLPGLDGRQVAEAGRATRPGLRILFMTGYAENAALAAGFLEPGMALITKPFAMDALTERIGVLTRDGA